MKSVLDRAALKKPLALFMLAIACVAAMPLLGFLGSMFLFCFIQLTCLEKEKQPLLWRLVYSVAIVGGVYWLFKALMIYLPAPFWLCGSSWLSATDAPLGRAANASRCPTARPAQPSRQADGS